MGLFDFFRGLFAKARQKPIEEGIIENAFNVVPASSKTMQDNIVLWYALYINQPPWKNEDVHPLGIAGSIGKEFTRNTLSEFTMAVSGGPRADYMQQVIDCAFLPNLRRTLELGLCLGGVAYKPYIDSTGRLFIDATGATAFSPTEFDGAGRAIAGVFREVAYIKYEPYCRLEYHGWEIDENGTRTYIIQNKVYRGETGGGDELPLDTVPRWSAYQPEVRIINLDQPLFSYFRNPSSNNIEPESLVGVSIYGGEPNIELLKQADEQWERIFWEFESGERKIFNDGPDSDVKNFSDRLFQRGLFTPSGELFNVFSPEFRHEALYSGFQWILQRLEYSTGLSFGTLSDPQSVEKTATEILAAKERQRKTVGAIQQELETTIDQLLAAMSAYCDLYNLAPVGDYETVYSWGDGVMDDPETIRQDKALDMQEISSGITAPWEYRVKWFGETPDEAQANLPEAESLMEDSSFPDDVE